MHRHLVKFSVLSLAGCLMSCVPGDSAAEENIRLQDGAEFTGTVLQKDGERVVISLPRGTVAAIDGQPLPPPIIRGTAAPRFQAVDLAGTTHALPDSQRRITLLKFWATWCPHCRADIPLVQELFARYRDQGFRVVAVSVDRELGALKQFVQDQQLRYPIIATTGAYATTQGDLPDRYEVQGIPAYFLIDANGTVAETFAGSAVETQRDLEGLIRRALASLASSAAPQGAASERTP